MHSYAKGWIRVLPDAKLFIIIDLTVSCAPDRSPCCFILLAARFPKVDPRLNISAEILPLSAQQKDASKFRGFCGETKKKTKKQQNTTGCPADAAPAPVCGAAGGLNGHELCLPSTLVRVSTGLLQADSGATLAECFFMMLSSDGLSSKPLRLHP